MAPDPERYGRGDDAPSLVEPALLEGSAFRNIRVTDPDTLRGQSHFAGFLDGTQDVRVVTHVHGIPIVWATVSAAVRARVDRKLVSWTGMSPVVRRRFYIPFRYVESMSDTLRSHRDVSDTTREGALHPPPSRHPAAVMEAAVNEVQRDRELAESQLAEAWCASGSAPLYIDGSITASAIAASSPLAIGVIKSHRRLYAEGPAFPVLMALEAGERSSAFRVAPSSRNAVASWYVRVRPAKGRDALFGLVRVEAAETADITALADEISRWVIAEGAPLALPDGRWDKMAYGIRGTEEYLRAIS